MYNTIQTNSFQHSIINSIYNITQNQETSYQNNLNLFRQEQIKQNQDLTNIFKILFNNYDYESLLNIIPLMNFSKDDEIKVQRVVNLYKNWDSFEYDQMKAYKINEFPKILKPIEYKYNENIKGLKKTRTKYKEYRLVIDLLNNAKRRNIEGKNNEAILQLYRTMELVTHIKLLKIYKIDTKNVDINRLEQLNVNKSFINYLNNLSNKYNTINISLKDHFSILQELNDPIGKFYHDNYALFLEIIKMRHSSLLVHGTNNISAVQYQEYEYLVRKLAYMLNKKIKKYVVKTEFPILD